MLLAKYTIKSLHMFRQIVSMLNILNQQRDCLARQNHSTIYKKKGKKKKKLKNNNKKKAIISFTY